MIHVHLPHFENRPSLPALGDRARRALGRFRGAERTPRPAADRRPAVYSASLGCHPHLDR
ncbi:hypothetical protein [Nocardia wallacei]|uniref:Uncharacterized protein n=1 Tax=Nocardia wallacei TaxID=480035 RepID=A0A7G1KPM0_9NOCA|nr:hypothetical protein [Nocardia wallacei]BCK57187.1 hypothetical protein NWFMUON74_49590 [Nocardia wallacei]